MEPKRIKNIFRGVFNLNRQVFVMYAYAYSSRQAWAIFCRRIADKHNINVTHTMNYFNGDKNNYEITIEVEFKEDETQAN